MRRGKILVTAPAAVIGCMKVGPSLFSSCFSEKGSILCSSDDMTRMYVVSDTSHRDRPRMVIYDFNMRECVRTARYVYRGYYPTQFGWLDSVCADTTVKGMLLVLVEQSYVASWPSWRLELSI